MQTERRIVHDNFFAMGVLRWLYDLWHSAIEQVESGHAGETRGLDQPRSVIGDNPWFDVVTRQQVTFTTTHLYEQFNKRIKDMRPWNFITTRPALLPSDLLFRGNDEQMNGGDPSKYEGIAGVPFYESYDEGMSVVHQLDTGAVVDLQHKTLREVMREYFNHPEAKVANPHGSGALERRHVVAVDHV